MGFKSLGFFQLIGMGDTGWWSFVGDRRLRERHHFFLRRKVHTGSGFGEAIWGFSGADSADFGEGGL